jgi:hypothetical protein
MLSNFAAVDLLAMPSPANGEARDFVSEFGCYLEVPLLAPR